MQARQGARAKEIGMNATKKIYYNGFMWHMVLLPGGTRAVWPSRLDGSPVAGSAARFYRGPARMSPATRHDPDLAVSGA